MQLKMHKRQHLCLFSLLINVPGKRSCEMCLVHKMGLKHENAGELSWWVQDAKTSCSPWVWMSQKSFFWLPSLQPC